MASRDHNLDTANLPSVKDLMAEAAFQLVKESLSNPDKTVAAVKATDVLSRTSKLAREAGTRSRGELTTGALYRHFPGGAKDAVNEGIRRNMDPKDTSFVQDVVTASMLDFVKGREPDDIRGDLAAADLENLLRDTGASRVWALLWAYSAREEASTILRQTYTEFDRLLVPLYEAELAARGRRMRPGLSVQDLAIAVTALIEGLAMRALSDGGESASPPGSLGLERAGAIALVKGMTEADT